MTKDAVLDSSGQYRYSLLRVWAPGDWVTWIMLNPSTADALVDDPTIRRCIAFSNGWGFAGMQVVNLYAYRSPNPASLKTIQDPIGPEHASHFSQALGRGKLTVAAWGSCKHASTAHVAHLLKSYSIKCLGRTADGSPRHPLYVRADAALEDWKS